MMDDPKFDQEEINRLINGAWNAEESESEQTVLRRKFESRLLELNSTARQAGENLQVEFRTLYGILDGTLKRLDILSVLKIAHFLEVPYNEIIELYAKAVADRNKVELTESRKRLFILNNFDLPVLKSMGVISSIRDFGHIEQSLINIFGINSILDYDTEDVAAALSSTKVKPKNQKSRRFFKSKSKAIFRLISNPHPYDKQAVIDYFPKVRRHSIDVDYGIVNVIKSLFDLGVTVIYQPNMPSLQMRGATFEVNGKPCIVLTDYRSTYPTMWFALLHELFHVLFDWDEILNKRYHLSDEENDLFVLKHKEDEANEFAREYLFPSQKMELISSRIKQRVIVKEFALDNHVHPSIVYANYVFKNSTDQKQLWAQFEKLIRPPMENLVKVLSNNLSHNASASEFSDYYSHVIFNSKQNG